MVHGDHGVNKVGGSSPKCVRCGKTNHSSETCFHRKVHYYGCNQLGHIVKKCRKKKERRTMYS